MSRWTFIRSCLCAVVGLFRPRPVEAVEPPAPGIEPDDAFSALDKRMTAGDHWMFAVWSKYTPGLRHFDISFNGSTVGVCRTMDTFPARGGDIREVYNRGVHALAAEYGEKPAMPSHAVDLDRFVQLIADMRKQWPMHTVSWNFATHDDLRSDPVGRMILRKI